MAMVQIGNESSAVASLWAFVCIDLRVDFFFCRLPLRTNGKLFYAKYICLTERVRYFKPEWSHVNVKYHRNNLSWLNVKQTFLTLQDTARVYSSSDIGSIPVVRRKIKTNFTIGTWLLLESKIIKVIILLCFQRVGLYVIIIYYRVCSIIASS